MKRIICLLLACVMLLCFAGCADEPEPQPEPDDSSEPVQDEPEQDTEPEPEPEPDEGEDEDDSLTRVVSECGEDQLTNKLLNYYYWLGFGNFYSVYADTFDLSTEVPLAEQEYTSEKSWQEYFTDYAVELWQAMVMFKHAGEEAGYEMAAEYQNFFDDFRADLEATAENVGCDNIEDYLRLTYGEGSDYDSFYQFYYDYYYAMSYYYSVYDDMYAEYQASGDTINLVSVRHVLIKPTNTTLESDWEAAEAQAQELYDEWQAAGGGETYLATLAQEHSTDLSTRSSGGLYEDVEPGQLPDGFDDWCYDPARQPGDSDIVETSYGYHIVYFVGVGELYTGDAADYLAQRDHLRWADAYAANFAFTTDLEKAEIFIDFG